MPERDMSSRRVVMQIEILKVSASMVKKQYGLIFPI